MSSRFWRCKFSILPFLGLPFFRITSYISSGLFPLKIVSTRTYAPIRFICAPRSCELKLVQYSTPMCNVFARVHIYIYIFLFVCIYIFIYIFIYIYNIIKNSIFLLVFARRKQIRGGARGEHPTGKPYARSLNYTTDHVQRQARRGPKP